MNSPQPILTLLLVFIFLIGCKGKKIEKKQVVIPKSGTYTFSVMEANPKNSADTFYSNGYMTIVKDIREPILPPPQTVYIHDTVIVYRNPPKEKYKQIPYKIIKHYSGWADPRVSPQSWLGTDSFFHIEKYPTQSDIKPFTTTTMIH